MNGNGNYTVVVRVRDAIKPYAYHGGSGTSPTIDSKISFVL